jgi:hypothetical protein
MFRLDTLSCALTVLSTVLVGRKLWTGLVVAGVNSVVICVIGLRTAQFGLIPANLFCIGVYAVSVRSWMRERGGALITKRAKILNDSAELQERRIDASRKKSVPRRLKRDSSTSVAAQLKLCPLKTTQDRSAAFGGANGTGSTSLRAGFEVVP